MERRKIVDYWKYPAILLFGIGISSIGSWIYFIALNVIVFNMTGSPLAVAALYIINPLATLFTNLWGGSVVDRVNKKHFMIVLDLIQGVLITCLAFSTNTLWAIYLFVFLINMVSSLYDPTSIGYITRLIPREQRQRFNSLRSLLDSGAFILGPAITGMLFILGTPLYAIFINGLSFFFSALVTLWMPNVEKNKPLDHVSNQKLSLHVIKKDFMVVIRFSRRYLYVMIVYFLFTAFVVLQTAVDSLEVAFAREVISLSEGAYGFLVSTAGAGILIGALCNAVFAKKLSIRFIIGLGSVMVSVGYLIFAFSSNFTMASVGFFVLAFSLAFANTGFHTFYQNNIPVEIIGRISSIYGFLEALLVIVLTAIFAVGAQVLSIKLVVISGASSMFILTIVLFIICLAPSKRKHYDVAP
ncbi:MFS transporter [Ornithinibacillus sp. FSL M8-0202]|uniref:MFS transporter n=1 Tax=unclassified Ornithinibacillus TaxID=2620869 RepID=UPI0030CADA1D